MVIVEDLIKAHEAIKKAYAYADKAIKSGASYKQVVDEVEDIILKHANLAFPANFSVNNVAAHDTAMENDSRVVEQGDVIKLDIGAEVNGAIVDVSKTYVVGNNDLGKEIKAVAEGALNAALEVLEQGVNISEIGKAVEQYVHDKGYGVVINLTGHSIEPYTIHGSFSIPNVGSSSNVVLEKGMVVAIEPFVVSIDEDVMVKDMQRIEIYEYAGKGCVPRSRYARMLLQEIKSSYGRGLPFAKRWLRSLKGIVKEKALQELLNAGCINGYPVLYYPDSDVLIAQAEATVYLGDEIKIFRP